MSISSRYPEPHELELLPPWPFLLPLSLSVEIIVLQSQKSKP